MIKLSDAAQTQNPVGFLSSSTFSPPTSALFSTCWKAPTCSPFPPNFPCFKVCSDTWSTEGNMNRHSWPPASLSVSAATHKSRGIEAWRPTRDEEAECHQRAGGAQGGVTRFDLARVRMRQRAAGNMASSFPNRKYFDTSKMMQLLENMLSVRMFSPCAALATPIFSALKQTGKFNSLSENSKYLQKNNTFSPVFAASSKILIFSLLLCDAYLTLSHVQKETKTRPSQTWQPTPEWQCCSLSWRSLLPFVTSSSDFYNCVFLSISSQQQLTNRFCLCSSSFIRR